MTMFPTNPTTGLPENAPVPVPTGPGAASRMATTNPDPMTGIDEAVPTDLAPEDREPPRPGPAQAQAFGVDARNPTPHFTIRIPGPHTYANALKRTADQAGNDQGGPSAEQATQSEEEPVDDREPKLPGPIKGFSTERVLENLDPLVRAAWESRTDDTIFVHYLDGGYNPNVAQSVHVIAEDLKSECLGR